MNVHNLLKVYVCRRQNLILTMLGGKCYINDYSI